MRVARLYGVGDIRVEQAPVPEVPDGHTLVRVTDVGLCGSDLHWYTEGSIGDATLERPLIPGHEFAGIGASGVLDGVRVAVDPAIPCGHCTLCVEGHRNMCENIRFSGHSTLDGALAEYIAWPTEQLHPLPDDVSGADGAMLEPLGVALHAWDLGHTRAASTVAVVGCGPIGLMMIQLALSSGADRVIAVEPLPHRREAALRAGAAVALDVPEALDPATWREHAGLGVDTAYEVAGNDGAIAVATLAARPGGRVVLIGIPSNDRASFTAGTARRKGLTYVLVRRMKEMYPRTIRLVSSGRVDVTSVVSTRVGLADITHAFDAAARREGLKVVVDLT